MGNFIGLEHDSRGGIPSLPPHAIAHLPSFAASCENQRSMRNPKIRNSPPNSNQISPLALSKTTPREPLARRHPTAPLAELSRVGADP